MFTRNSNTLVARKKATNVIKKTKTVVKLTKFKTVVYSRHPSHKILRNSLPLLPFRSCVRLGSTTIVSDVISLGGNRIECNSIAGVRNSSSKLLMKRCFTRENVKTADWLEGNNININQIIERLGLPVIAKSLHGSRGEGNSKLNTRAELETWLRGKNLSNYIFEKFYTYSREYRLHVTNDGCFYSCRKMLRSGTPESEQWHRHDSNSVWIVEENPQFDKPVNWRDIVQDCIRAKNALGLDICAFDVKVQGRIDNNGRNRTNPEWIVIESCSAPSFGEITARKYLIEIPKLLMKKYEQRR